MQTLLRLLFFAAAIVVGLLGMSAIAIGIFAVLTGLPAMLVTFFAWTAAAVGWQIGTIKLATKLGFWGPPGTE